jgi:hypothetical protein
VPGWTTLRATLPGYLEETFSLRTPGPDQEIRFDLRADPLAGRQANPPENVPPPPPAVAAAVGTALIVVLAPILEVEPPEPLDTAALVDHLGLRLAGTPGVSIVPAPALAGALSRLAAQGQALDPDDPASLDRLGTALGSRKVLVTRLTHSEQGCAFTAILHDLAGGENVLAATGETPCTQRALLAALDQIAGQLGASPSP